MYWYQLEKLVAKVSFALCTASLLVVMVSVYAYLQEKNQQIENAKLTAKEETNRAAEEIDRQLREIMNAANAIADDLSTQTLTKQNLVDRLRTTLQENPKLFGVGATYVPYAYDSKTRLYGPYYTRRDGQLELLKTESLYDYTEPQYERYHLPLKKGPTWIEPYFGKSSNTLIALFGAPFYFRDTVTQEKIPQGVISATFSLEQVKKLMNSLDLGKTGYGILVSEQKKIIYHPIERFLLQDVSDNKFLNQDLFSHHKIKNQDESFIEAVNPHTGEDCWILSKKIPATGWNLSVVFMKEQLFGSSKRLEHQLIWISLGTIFFLFFFAIFLLQNKLSDVKILAELAALASILAIIEIGFIWYLALKDTGIGHETTMLLDEAGVQGFLASNLMVNSPGSESDRPLEIPTGVFVQAIEFVNANNVFVSGYIWQKYYDGIHDDIEQGFRLPEGISVKITESYRQKFKGYEVIGWYFESQLRQNFDYSQYPFDYKDVWIRLWPKDNTRPIILVPDFEGYELMVPSSLPGVEQEIVLSGLTLEKSYFEYKINNYNTNFGLGKDIGYWNYPQLYFTILMKREFVTVFVTNIMRILVVSFLLFAIQLIVGKKAEEMKLIGFSASGVISACGAFIFIIVLDQTSLRTRIAVAGILYIEYLYFVLYIMIFLVALNALLLASKSKLRLTEYRDNLIPKLSYWPVLTQLFLIATLLVFY